MTGFRCRACNAYGWHTVDCPVGLREERRPGADRLDLDRLVSAMDGCYGYEDRDNAVPTLPFIDDIEGFWEPFARCVAAEYERLSREPETP